MARYTFNIGEVLPASDPVARFVTVLAMVSNDWHRTMTAMNASLDGDDGAGVRLLLFRQEASYCYEASKFVMESRARYPQIDRFLTDLGREAEYASIEGVREVLGEWLGKHRNITFHYPELVPQRFAAGKDEIANALDKAAGTEGEMIIGDTFTTVRFGFADEVAIGLFGLDRANLEDEFRKLVAPIANARKALGLFAYSAVTRYLESKDDHVHKEP